MHRRNGSSNRQVKRKGKNFSVYPTPRIPFRALPRHRVPNLNAHVRYKEEPGAPARTDGPVPRPRAEARTEDRCPTSHQRFPFPEQPRTQDHRMLREYEPELVLKYNPR